MTATTCGRRSPTRKCPREAEKAALKELQRLSRMSPAAADYTVTRTYLDWLVTLPWSQSSESELSIPKAHAVLEADHYNLEKVKERILEYLSVLQLRPGLKGPILCFVGPPGVGKTSLGKSIARALGRKFVRISLGGMHDEAEIRGHRRTYIGALPGQIIQGIRRAGTNNPVFMLDEVDKIGRDFRGDPAAALLETLDPEQNFQFRDHYLDVPFDLSKVLFITTANVLDPIPDALRDRMEVLELPGYTEEEKVQIALRHVLPHQAEEHGVRLGEQIEFPNTALLEIIRYYTREAGLRNLERHIAAVCRKQARRIAEGQAERLVVTSSVVRESLGAPMILPEMENRRAHAAPGRRRRPRLDAHGRRRVVCRSQPDARQARINHDGPSGTGDAGIHAGDADLGAFPSRPLGRGARTTSRTMRFTCTSPPARFRRTARRPV